jgi:predicted DNA repair protein MutK
MAGGSLLLLLDDIAALLDDVALMTKVAAKKTAGVLGDDLAVNAEQVTGVKADRELPVVWAVAKGSLRNKMILVPAALLAATFAPWAITPVLMLGGLYLCYEGFEKIVHEFWQDPEEKREESEHRRKMLTAPTLDPLEYEKKKVSGAIRTDFILSIEIIVITLGIVADSDFLVQLAVLAGVAILMTVGVYGAVAGIVKLDDAGLYLSQMKGPGALRTGLRWLGLRLLDFAPFLMKALTYIGTLAMFLVGGGILVHGMHDIGASFEAIARTVTGIDVVGPFFGTITPLILNALFGIGAGAVVLLLTKPFAALAQRLKGRSDTQA